MATLVLTRSKMLLAILIIHYVYLLGATGRQRNRERGGKATFGSGQGCSSHDHRMNE